MILLTIGSFYKMQWCTESEGRTEWVVARHPSREKNFLIFGRFTTSALLQLTTDIETDFNQRKPPHRAMYVTINLTAAFDTVSHDILISRIAGWSLPPAITRWLSCYLRGIQVATSFKDTKSSMKIIHTASLKVPSCHLHSSTIT